MKASLAFLLAVPAALAAHTVGGCSAAQQASDARLAATAEPGVFGLCGLAEPFAAAVDPGASPFVDVVCSGAEATDKAIAGLAPQGVQAQVVSESVAVGADGGEAKHLYRVRCTFRPNAYRGDSGRDAP